jgi:DNA-binding response OmpR family regulator
MIQTVMDFQILVVDDESTCVSTVSDYFGSQGFKVTTAGELEEAEALIIKYQYSLVISDLSLTALNSDEGLRLIDLIRDRSPRTKIILLSGRVSPEVRSEALKRGAQAVLEKPQRLASLGAMAEALLEVRDELHA